MVLNENFLGTGLAVPQNRSAIAAERKKSYVRSLTLPNETSIYLPIDKQSTFKERTRNGGNLSS